MRWICFHSISSPSEWERRLGDACILASQNVSIQLVLPASGKGEAILRDIQDYLDVSIQLVLPASGKVRFARRIRNPYQVSIQLVLPASGKAPPYQLINAGDFSFHSISSPSEWESSRTVIERKISQVSIQLVLPASGKVRALKRPLALYSTREFDG